MSSLLSYFYTSVQEDLKFGEEDLIEFDKLKTIPEDKEITDFEDEDSSEDDLESYLDEEEHVENDKFEEGEDSDIEDRYIAKSINDRKEIFCKIVKSELSYTENAEGRPAKGMLAMRLFSYIYNTFFYDEELLNFFRESNHNKRFIDTVIKKTTDLDDNIVENLNYENDRRISDEVSDELWRLNVKLRNLLE